MPSREAGWSSSSTQEYHDDGQAAWATPHGPIRPIAYISIGGSKYCLVIVDDYSRFTWVFFLQEKSQTQKTLKGFLRWAQNEFGLRIKKIRSDNGTEFKNSQIEGFLEKFQILKCFLQSYLYAFDYLQTDFEKIFQKNLQKQNKWCRCGPKC